MKCFNWFFMLLLLCFITVFGFTGCNGLSKTAQTISGDLGDKATSGTALVNITKVTGSDALANGSPTGKNITIIGNLKSVPIKGKAGDIVKDYGEYRYTESPAWYNSANITKETVIIFTGDNVKELKNYLLNKRKNTEKTENSIDKSKTPKPSEQEVANTHIEPG
jgi:hypothetical protein